MCACSFTHTYADITTVPILYHQTLEQRHPTHPILQRTNPSHTISNNLITNSKTNTIYVSMQGFIWSVIPRDTHQRAWRGVIFQKGNRPSSHRHHLFLNQRRPKQQHQYTTHTHAHTHGHRIIRASFKSYAPSSTTSAAYFNWWLLPLWIDIALRMFIEAEIYGALNLSYLHKSYALLMMQGSSLSQDHTSERCNQPGGNTKHIIPAQVCRGDPEHMLPISVAACFYVGRL